MIKRSTPSGSASARWRAIIIVTGLASAICSLFFGQEKAVLAVLACLGTTGSILFAAGQIGFKQDTLGRDRELGEVLSALPAAFAVTDKRGLILWRSEAFLDLFGNMGADNDLSRLGLGNAETSGAIFRLFAAARKGRSHAEAISGDGERKSQAVVLKVLPAKRGGSLFIWHANEVNVPSRAGGSRSEILNALPVPALSVSRDLSVEAINKSFEELCGSNPVGNEAWLLFRSRRGNPLTRAQLRDMIAKASGPISVQVASASGFFRPVSVHSATAPDGAQGERGRQLWIVTSADQTSGSIEESFETLLERAPMPMALMSLQGVIQSANLAFRGLFGEAGDKSAGSELAGKTLASLVAPASLQKVRDKLDGLASNLAQAGKASLDVELRERNSRAQLAIFPAAIENNALVCVAEGGSSALIGEQAAQNQKLQAVGELAGGIAHDFNNLLTAIIGFSDLLLRRFRASDPAFKDLMNIKNNATRAAELVSQILAYSRRQTLRPALLKLTDTIEQFHATMGRTLGEKVKIAVQHGRDLWFVKADEGQIFQVIMNLAVNARDAMAEGGEIAISTANVSERESLGLKDRGLDRGEYVLCEVRDTGTGIKPEHLEKIFDPFFSTKEIGKGTGLGLSTVYGIVKQTGGAILVDSEIGVGTSFKIFLPRYFETEHDLKTLESKPEAPEKIVDLTGRGTVLLVEDEEAVRSFATRALASRGYTVLEAASGAEALEIMDRAVGRVDLVVSDVIMPEMDGPTLLRHLRMRNPEIRIVFMSGYAEEAFRKNLSEDEDFIFLPKPFTLKKLAETVKAAAA